MENDPPPSYNSVVLGDNNLKNRRTNKQTSPDDSHDQQDKNGLQRNKPSSNQEKEALRAVELGESTRQTPASDQDPSSQLEEPRNGLWNRFKKCLENIALFVIQILD